MSALKAGARLERLLSIVPWVAANDGPTVAEIAARFDYKADTLLEDLTEILFMVGLYPHSPDNLIEVKVEDDRVWIHYAEYFERPLRLTPAQALALVTAGSSLLSVPGADPSGPLARGLEKLATTLGVTPGEDLEVDLGKADAGVLGIVREAIAGQRQLDIEYYTYGRDEVTSRTVDPYRVVSDQGQWYLLAHCHKADGERLFRIDRIRSAVLTDSSFIEPDNLPEISVFEARPDDQRVTLRLQPGAFWVAEAHPVEQSELLKDGSKRVTLAITELRWLERLLLRLGADAELESATGDIPMDLVQTTAQRVLARYQPTD